MNQLEQSAFVATLGACSNEYICSAREPKAPVSHFPLLLHNFRGTTSSGLSLLSDASEQTKPTGNAPARFDQTASAGFITGRIKRAAGRKATCPPVSSSAQECAGFLMVQAVPTANCSKRIPDSPIAGVQCDTFSATGKVSALPSSPSCESSKQIKF